MGLQANILAAVDAAFLAIGDLAFDAIYISPSTGTLDPITETYTGAPVSTNIKVVKSERPTQDNNADGVEVSTPNILIKANDLSEPLSSNGKIVMSGETYDIKSWDIDPAGAVYDVVIRRST